MQLVFHLAGINNQNFLMRDEQTGSFWQQITGLAISGPLAGERLTLVHSDEISFAVWKAEQPGGTVLTDDARFVKEYASKDWDKKMARYPTVISFAAGASNEDGTRTFAHPATGECADRICAHLARHSQR